MSGRLVRASAWSTAAALVVLAARTFAYALAPQPTALSLELERAAGGPRLVVVAAVVLGCAAAAAVAMVGLAALAVRERLELERAVVLSPPRIRPLRVSLRATALFVVTALAFALLESYLHWRAGLGWHGLHCLTGPVHRDALPILAALSLVAAAAAEAVEHLVAWAHRTLARFLPRLRPLRPVGPRIRPLESHVPEGARPGCAPPARGPPRARRRAHPAARAALEI
jgi:hypothetical protein